MLRRGSNVCGSDPRTYVGFGFRFNTNWWGRWGSWKRQRFSNARRLRVGLIFLREGERLPASGMPKSISRISTICIGFVSFLSSAIVNQTNTLLACKYIHI